MMRALVASEKTISPVTRPIPVPGPGEVLIEVAYAGVNRADLVQVAGHYDPPPGSTDILGLEVSGRRADTGEEVMALLTGGGYAEYVVVPEGQVMPVPDGLSLAEAATIPESLTTAWSNLADARLAAGESLYVQGGSGSVGVVALQLGREAGAFVIASAGTAERCSRIQDFGVAALDHHGQVAAAIEDFTDGRGLDVALNIMGRDLGSLLPLMAPGGRIAVFGVQGGRKAEIDVFALMSRRLSMTGSTLRSRCAKDKARLVADAAAFALPRYESGDLVPVLDRVFDLGDAGDAHEYVRAGSPFGKVLLQVR